MKTIEPTSVAANEPTASDPAQPQREPLELDLDDIVNAKLRDSMVPGYEAAFDPDEATHAGAFVEDALDYDAARESSTDYTLAPPPPPPRLALIDDGGPTDLPAYITVRPKRGD